MDQNFEYTKISEYRFLEIPNGDTDVIEFDLNELKDFYMNLTEKQKDLINVPLFSFVNYSLCETFSLWSGFKWEGFINNCFSKSFLKIKETVERCEKIENLNEMFVLFYKKDWIKILSCLNEEIKCMNCNDECSLCLEKFKNIDFCYTNCGHKYHTSCLVKYDIKVCPFCKNLISQDEKSIPQNENYKRMSSCLGVIVVCMFVILFSPIILLVSIVGFIRVQICSSGHKEKKLISKKKGKITYSEV